MPRADLVIDPLANPDGRPDLKAHVQGKGAKPRNASAGPTPNGYYVILGCGAAAVVDHATLRQSKAGQKRLYHKGEPLAVMHVGHEDPWLHYHAHGMGQPPYLLRLPGYHDPVDPGAECIRTGLKSTVFAASTKAELDKIRRHFPKTYWTEAWVAGLESQVSRLADLAGLGPADALSFRDLLVSLNDAIESGPKFNPSDLTTMLEEDFPADFPFYRLLVVLPDGALRWVYAWKVDLCSGAGVMNLVPRTGAVPLFNKALKSPWLPTYRWDEDASKSPVVHGMDGLTRHTVWKSRPRVCVYGAGGIGLNQVERSHDEGCLLDWVTTGTFQATYNLRRNDTVLRRAGTVYATAQAPVAKEDFADAGSADVLRANPPNPALVNAFTYVPGSTNWRFGQNITLGAGKLKDEGLSKLVDLTFQGGATTRMWDAFPKANPAPPLVEYPALTPISGTGVFPFSARYAAAHVGATVTRGERFFDLLVVCIGQNPKSPGEPSQIAAGFDFTPVLYKNRVVALAADDGDIRLLGAAAAMYPAAIGSDVATARAGADTTAFHDSLPVSAVVPGFIRSGVNIAAANGYFDDPGRANRNINTATKAELVAALNPLLSKSYAEVAQGKLKPTPDDLNKLADLIVSYRQAPENGISSLDRLVELLSARRDLPMFNPIGEVVRTHLSFDYPPALEYPEPAD